MGGFSLSAEEWNEQSVILAQVEKFLSVVICVHLWLILFSVILRRNHRWKELDSRLRGNDGLGLMRVPAPFRHLAIRHPRAEPGPAKAGARIHLKEPRNEVSGIKSSTGDRRQIQKFLSVVICVHLWLILFQLY